MEHLVIFESEITDAETAEIERRVREKDLICTSLPLEIVETYTAQDYLREKLVNRNEIHAILDRNITTRLTTAAESGEVRTEAEQDAIALLCFLRIAQVELEPGVSIAEYSDSCGNSDSDRELTLLRKIDNIPNENLLDLALGKTSSVDILKSSHTGDAKVKEKISCGEELHHWRLSYGYALKMFLLHHECASRVEFMEGIMKWMWKDYVIGGIAIPFAVAFASQKFGGMIKGINSTDIDKVLKGVRNAAWDMMIVQYWSKKAEARTGTEAFLQFCTADKALRCVARRVLCFDDQDQDDHHLFRIFDGLFPRHEARKVVDLFASLESNSQDPRRAVHRYRKDNDCFNEDICALEKQVIRKVKELSS